jgi:uncharacterized protein
VELRDLDIDVRRSVADKLDEMSQELSDEERAALHLLLARSTEALDTMALAATPVEELFDPDEQAVIAELDALPDPEHRLVPMPTLIMKATRLCNLRCTYCNAWEEGPGQRMPFEVLARTTHGLLRNPGVVAPTFVWHGGEPTLQGVRFYLRALWLQLHWRRDTQTVRNQLQTNATRLEPDFVELCRRFHISVSVSLDGPPEIHDRQRVDAAGRPTSERVRAGIAQLQEAGLEPGILMVVDQDTVRLGPQRVLDYLLELEVPAVGLLNVVPNIGPNGVNPLAPWLPWGTWQTFLRDLFRLWYPTYVDRIQIRELSELVRALDGQTPRKCHNHSDCFSFAFTVEPDGDVGPCDKYVGDPSGRYGSVLSEPVEAVLTGPGVQRRREADAAEVAELAECQWMDVCKGGCPFDRAVNAARGAEGTAGCCGLGPLLEEMSATIAGEGPTDALERAFTAASAGPAGVPQRAARNLPVIAG